MSPLTPCFRRNSTTHRVPPLENTSPEDRDEAAALAGTSFGGAAAAMTARQARRRTSPLFIVWYPDKRSPKKPLFAQPASLPNEQPRRGRLFRPTLAYLFTQATTSREERGNEASAIKNFPKMTNIRISLSPSRYFRISYILPVYSGTVSWARRELARKKRSAPLATAQGWPRSSMLSSWKIWCSATPTPPRPIPPHSNVFPSLGDSHLTRERRSDTVTFALSLARPRPVVTHPAQAARKV